MPSLKVSTFTSEIWAPICTSKCLIGLSLRQNSSCYHFISHCCSRDWKWHAKGSLKKKLKSEGRKSEQKPVAASFTSQLDDIMRERSERGKKEMKFQLHDDGRLTFCRDTSIYYFEIVGIPNTCAALSGMVEKRNKKAPARICIEAIKIWFFFLLECGTFLAWIWSKK